MKNKLKDVISSKFVYSSMWEHVAPRPIHPAFQGEQSRSYGNAQSQLRNDAQLSPLARLTLKF